MKTTYAILIATSLLATSATLSFADDYPLKTCIVTGDVLGGDLGPAVEIHHNGQLIKLCCKSCVAKFNRDPEKYLKKLPAASQK